jgi:hypothetical protein
VRGFCFRALVLFGAWLISASIARGAEWSDLFNNRQLIEGTTGQLPGNNSTATAEADEPEHGGRRARHSLWVSWIAPTNGLATLRIVGANFDSVLAVYRVKKGAPTTLHELERVTDNDDDRGDSGSFVQFGTRAGERYEIAVDGYRGATGDLTLRWEFESSAGFLPVIIRTDSDRAVRAGDTVTLSIAIASEGDDDDDIDLHWYLNDQELDDEDEPTLVIPNFQAANAGQYRVRVQLDDIRFFTEAVEIQITSEGDTSTLARNKPEDAVESPLIGSGAQPGLLGTRSTRRLGLHAPPGAGVARGYNGSQIFNTAYAGRDPLEPQHCGVAGGSSYWFAYQPPAAGLVEIDSNGSSFDTLLAVYTYTPPLNGYQDLVQVTCDDNSGANGSASRVQFNCERDRMYLIVLDGAQGSRGLAHLNYRLTTAPPASIAPAFTAQPASQTVLNQVSVTLFAAASGTAPLSFQWFKDAQSIPGATADTLAFAAVSPADAGTYTVTVTNVAGSATSQPAALTVLVPPTFVAQPSSQTVLNQVSVTLFAAASGTAPLSFQWFKDAQPIPGATADTLAFAAISPADAGSYTVTVTNLAGSATSQPATLSVLVPPAFTTQPASQTVLDQVSVTLFAAASGTAPLSFQWFKDTQPIPGATADTLAFAAISPADAGTYTVTVTNLAGSATSQPAALTVLVPPAITTQPASQTVLNQVSVTLFAAASGTAPLSFQWFKDAQSIPGATADTLAFAAISPADAGTYTVTVTNVAGSATSQPATLNVLVPPAITTQPASQTVLNQVSVTLFAAASGTAPLSFQWFKDAQPIPGATSDTLAFAAVSPADAGTYTVTVANVAGSATSQPAALTVLVPPTFTTQPASQTVLNQVSVTLFAAASGTAPLSFQWFKDAQPIPGATSDTLAFAAVSPADAGTYTVTVANVAGSATSQPAALTVLVPPTFTTQPASQTVLNQVSVTLFAAASGTAPLSFQWFKDAQPIPGATADTLAFAAVSPADAGSYTVTVNNLAGSVTSQPAVLSVWAPAQVVRDPVSQRLILRYTTTGLLRARVEVTDNLGTVWLPWTESPLPESGEVTLELPFNAGSRRFVRVIVE